jgi:hypothetical protein
MKQRTPYQILSNTISTASDTGDLETLQTCDYLISTCLADGRINLPEAGELTLDCDLAISALGTMDETTDYVRHALTERSVDSL